MKYRFTIACDVRAYGTVEVEAADRDAAWARACEIADEMNAEDGEVPPEMEGVVMKAEYDLDQSYEVLDDIEEVPE